MPFRSSMITIFSISSLNDGLLKGFFSWLYNFKRIALDYEFYSESSEAMIQIAFLKIMLNKLSN